MNGQAKRYPDVSIIVVGWNTQDLLRDCLESVLGETKEVSYEIIYVDNASEDGSAEMVREEFPTVQVIANSENMGFVAANNQAIAVSKGRYVLLLNSDTVVLENAIGKIIRFADENPQGAVFGCRVLNQDYSLQRSCFMYPSLVNLVLFASYLYKVFPRSRFFGRQQMTWWDGEGVREVQTVSGCFSLVRKAAIDEVGMMDPIFFFYSDDTDWCYRFSAAGWKILYSPEPRIIHLGGRSSNRMRRQFRLQLYGSQLLHLRLHRGKAVTTIARLLISLFFILRAPYWCLKGLLARRAEQRASCWRECATYLEGFVLCLFDWPAMLINQEAVRQRLRAIAGRKAAKAGVVPADSYVI